MGIEGKKEQYYLGGATDGLFRWEANREIPHMRKRSDLPLLGGAGEPSTSDNGVYLDEDAEPPQRLLSMVDETAVTCRTWWILRLR